MKRRSTPRIVADEIVRRVRNSAAGRDPDWKEVSVFIDPDFYARLDRSWSLVWGALPRGWDVVVTAMENGMLMTVRRP